MGRTDDHRGVVGETAEQSSGVGEHLFDLPVGAVEEGSDLLGGGPVEDGLGEGVDEVAIALLGGDPTGRGVRLRQEAVALQGRHLVANGGRRHTHAGRVGDVPGAHRLGGLDVLLHDGSEDGCLALVEHDHHLKVSLALDDTECQW